MENRKTKGKCASAMLLKTLVTGLLAGIFSALLGIGGGLVTIPLLTFLLGFSQKQAYGTSLAAIIISGATGAFAYHTYGTINYTMAGIITVTAIAASLKGVKYCNSQPEWKLKKLFGGFLLLSVLLLLSKPYLFTIIGAPGTIEGFLVLLGIGLISGFLSGLLGVGSGGIMVAGMVAFMGMSQVAAQGTALLIMVPTGIVGAYAHWRAGNIVVRVVARLMPGIFVGSYLGAALAHTISETTLLICFSFTLTTMAIRYLLAKPSQEEPKGDRK